MSSVVECNMGVVDMHHTCSEDVSLSAFAMPIFLAKDFAPIDFDAVV